MRSRTVAVEPPEHAIAASQPAPRIAFCTTCKGRADHLEQTLPRNLASNAHYHNAVFVVLNYNSADHLDAMLRENHAGDIDSGRVVVYRFTEPGPFRMAHAKNLAHRLGIIEGADILVNLDADNFTGAGFAQYIRDQWTQPEVFMCVDTALDHGPFSKNWSSFGRIAVTRHAFLRTGGYDERFSTYSPDDRDFMLRLIRAGGMPVRIHPRFYGAINHSDALRFKEYPGAAHNYINWKSVEESVSKSTATVANYGKVGRGVVFKNGGRVPVELSAIPTRIFGIGMQRTATSSLHSALGVLGFDSAHWDWGYPVETASKQSWAVYEEMNRLGRSPTLESYYCYTDLPMPLLYRQLDAKYPGSKFILTTRDGQRWLESARRHFGSQNQAAWDAESPQISHRLHRALYGTTTFDAGTFLRRYRRHNAEVREYFKSRPGDLLEMDTATAGWHPLCGFLRQTIPPVPYPFENRSVTP